MQILIQDPWVVGGGQDAVFSAGFQSADTGLQTTLL